MFHPKGPTLAELMRQALSSTKKGYDLLAPKFDFTPFSTSQHFLNPISEYLRSEREYDDALDLCTGTGAGIRTLSPIVRRKIIGVDWSGPMLEEAQKKLVAQPFTGPKIILVCKNILNLRYREEFDLATCFGALGHIERSKQKKFISVVHSALRPGGLFALDTISLRWHSPAFWMLFGFDAVMAARNIIVKPPFIMYYSNHFLPRVLRLFDKNKWSSVKAMPVKISGIATPIRLIIAKKK